MKNILTMSALLLLILGNALAGDEYDRCIKEEKVLKTKESSDCNGLKYLLNPSACFATQRLLKEYTAGKCKKIGITENVNFSVQTVSPEIKVTNISSVDQKRLETEVLQQESTIEQLKEENIRLKAEIVRLSTENNQLKKTGP
jgi:cell division protein FtsB